MKLLKPTWVNHNGECAQGSRKAEPGVESGSGVGSEPRAGPARLAPDAPGAQTAGSAGADFVLRRGKPASTGTCSACPQRIRPHSWHLL